MIRVEKNRKGEFELVYQLAALILIVDADGYNLCPSSGELFVVCGQTGQLLSAVRSPVASVEYEHDFRLATVVFQPDALPLR